MKNRTCLQQSIEWFSIDCRKKLQQWTFLGCAFFSSFVLFCFCPIDLSFNYKKTDLIVLSFNNILPGVVILRQDDDLQILGKSCNFNAVLRPCNVGRLLMLGCKAKATVAFLVLK